MDSLAITWIVAAAAALLVVLTIAYTLVTRRRVVRSGQQDGVTWKRAYHLGAELAAGRGIEDNSARLVELLDTSPQPLLAASAIAVAVRQEADDVNRALFVSVGRSRLPALLRTRLESNDSNDRIEALELVEVLRIHELLGDAAALTGGTDRLLVRAACDAVVEIEPSMGIGILIGLADRGETWVLDSLGRAADGLARSGAGPVPLARAQWQSAPRLAQRAMTDRGRFDRATVADAMSSLIGALDDPVPAKRLAAVSALAASIDHRSAQLALAGALGSGDRMVRYATASALSESTIGNEILRRAAAEHDGSDAARMAAELLWSHDPVHPEGLRLVSS